jgi:hypothetical protein
LPIAATVAVRGSSPSLYSQQYMLYDAVDPVTGAPINPHATGDARDELA